MKSDKKLYLAVIFGGKTPEHEVSVITGIQVLSNLDKDKYDVSPVYIAKDGNWYTSKNFFAIETFKNLDNAVSDATEVELVVRSGKAYLKPKKAGLLNRRGIQIDVAFPCLHGGWGENGAYQGLFESSDVAYVGSGVLGSALGMDKVTAKIIYQALGIPSAKFLSFYASEITDNQNAVIDCIERTFTYPVFVKPCDGGSSIGVSKANDREALINALEVAGVYSYRILVEEAILNAREINISVMGIAGNLLEVSECEEVLHKEGLLTYDEKYKGEGDQKSQGMVSTKRKLPADMDSKIKASIIDAAKRVFNALNLSGLARIDFLVREASNEIYVIEPNTIPGSMAFYLWEASGVKFPQLIDKLVELAIKKREMNSRRTTTFSTNLLLEFKSGSKLSKTGKVA